MFRKIIATIILSLLFLTNISQGYAAESLGEYSDSAIQVEKILPNISTEKLVEIDALLSPLVGNISGDKWAFVDYIATQVNSELELRKQEVPELILPSLSEEWKTETQNEVLEMQKNLESEISAFIDSAITSWNEMTRYEEKWNMKMSLNMWIEGFWNIEWTIDISDYISETQVFDQTFAGKIESFYSASMLWQELDMSLWADANIISKDGNIYLKFDNINSETSDKNVELQLNPYIEKLNELAKENTYLSMESDDYLEAVEFLTSMSSSNIRSQMQTAFEKPLLQAYAKTDDGYMMRPTKHFCDIGKEISGIFDPFGGDTCTPAQYQGMLDDMKDSEMLIIMNLWNENTLKLSFNEWNEEVELMVAWDNKSLISLSGDVKDGEDYGNFQYIPNNLLKAEMMAEDMSMNMIFDIDNNGNIFKSSMDMMIEDAMNLWWDYKNKKISMHLAGQDSNMDMKCSFGGDMKSQYIDISGWCDIVSPELAYQLPGGQENIRFDGALAYDWRANKNNISMNIDIDIDEKNYFNMSLSNTGTRRSVDKKNIQAPTQIKDIEEFMTEVYYQQYEDYNEFYETDYEYEYKEYDDYEEDCYTFENWDYTCTKYYKENWNSETCVYTAETDSEICEEYEAYVPDYEIKDYTFDDHTTTCYMYDNGDSSCYEYYDTYSNTCNFIAATNETNCSKYEYEIYDDSDTLWQ